MTARADHPERAELVERVARLFYEDQLTKLEIASRLGVSRFQVARLLDRALAEGVVRIEFRGSPGQDRDLAAALQRRFGVRRAVVASSDDPGALGRLGAEVLDGILEPDESIGIAWGSTVRRVVEAMPARSDPSIDVVQLAGSSPRLESEADPGELTRVLAERLGATHHRLHAPAFVDAPELRSALLHLPDIAGVASRFAGLSIALVGIGAFGDDSARPSSSLVRSGALGTADLKRLVRQGAVGDLLVHPFTSDGTFLAPDLAARAIAIGIDELRRVPTVVAVAAGSQKIEAIRGALATEIVTVLVTNATTARGVLG
jgi:DNA-binding transcriptional regulator LsrR (DeoR family)